MKITQFKLLIAVLAICLLPMASIFGGTNDGLKIGTKLKSFSATDDAGKLWRLSDHLNKEFLVIYFYPAALTSGCTKQACNVRDHQAELIKRNAEVVGVSGDPVKNLQYFKQKHQLNFTLLSDSSGAIAKLFAVPTGKGGSIERMINGKETNLVRYRTFQRWTYILDKSGKIVYKNTAVNAARDMDGILDFLRAQE